MTTNYPTPSQEPVNRQVPREPEGTMRALPGAVAADGQADPCGTSPPGGNAEAGFLSGVGKAIHRHVVELFSRVKPAFAREASKRDAADRIRRAADDRKHDHSGGNRTWLLRLLIPVGGAAEAVTAYVGVEVLVASQSLAIGLSALTAVVGVALACLLATRRLNGLGVPASVRVLEGLFVLILTVLRFQSLAVQGSSYSTAVGAAGLAALISALGLLGIEEIVVETHTFAMFIAALRASWAHWRWARAATALAATAAAAEGAADKLQRHYLEYLLRTEKLPLEEAQRRASALRAALASSETVA